VTLGAAIVGAGLMGRWHARAVADAGHRVVAVVDSSTTAAAVVASRHPGANVYARLEDVSAPIDVVHVCTPLATHDELVEGALLRGCHVVAEKPVATGYAATARLLELAESRGRMLVPVHQFLYQRGVLEAGQILSSIGALLHFDAVACTAGAAGRSSSERDRVALEVLPHPLSLAVRFLSPALSGTEWHVRHSRAGELRADGVLDGVHVSMLVSTNGRPTTNTLRLIAEHGTIHLDLFHGFAVVHRGPATRLGKIVQPFRANALTLAAATTNLTRRFAAREPAYPGLRELVRRSYRAAIRGEPSPISAAETLAVAAAGEHIAESIAAGGI
jgi:predicted dehydrogenase